MKESEIFTLYNEDTANVIQQPFQMMNNIRNLLKTFYSFFYAYLTLGPSALVFVAGNLLALFGTKYFYKFSSEHNQKSMEIKVKREGYILSMLKNFRLMKIFSLENTVFYNIEKFNLEEKNENKKYWKVGLLISAVVQIISLVVTTTFLVVFLNSGRVISPANIIVIMQLFRDSSISIKGILDLSEIVGIIKLSLEKFVRLLKLKETKEVTFTKYMELPEDLKNPTAIEVKNCSFFWVARKKKKDKKALGLIPDKLDASENLSETRDLSKPEFEDLELEQEEKLDGPVAISSEHNPLN